MRNLNVIARNETDGFYYPGKKFKILFVLHLLEIHEHDLESLDAIYGRGNSNHQPWIGKDYFGT